MGQNKAQRAAAERAKKSQGQSAAPEVQPQPAAEAKQPVAEQPKPTTPAPPSKQTQTIEKLTVAFREQRQIEVKPEMLTQDGKYINLLIGKDWPIIQIGASGGIVLPVIKSYPKAFEAAIESDKLLAKQNARDQKKAAASAPAPPAAAQPAPAPAPAAAKETPTAKKGKAHQQIEQQLQSASA